MFWDINQYINKSGGGQKTQPVPNTGAPLQAQLQNGAASSVGSPGTGTPTGPYSPYKNYNVPPPPTGQDGAVADGQGNYGKAPGAGYMPPPPGAWDPNWSPNREMMQGPSQADYESVQSYADAAHADARRYLDPMQKSQDQQMQQQLINQGIDPFSPQGQKRLDMLKRQQADANSGAAFDALQFGQGIQQQMFDQSHARDLLQGDLMQSLWGNQIAARGQDIDYGLGRGQLGLGYAGLENDFNIAKMGDETNRYGIDKNYKAAMKGHEVSRYGIDQNRASQRENIDLARQVQKFNENEGLWRRGFDTQVHNDNYNLAENAALRGYYSLFPPPTAPGVNPDGSQRGDSTRIDVGGGG